MLAEITIRNFAIIDELTVGFSSGMTVLSGETGAGKSILVDALNLILGDRADATTVREGSVRADITARFLLHDAPYAATWLSEHELDGEGDECLIRRVVAREGGSRGWVNGTPMPVRELRALGERLVNIHGQHAHQALLKHDTQRQLLDEYGKHDVALGHVADASARLRATMAAIERIEQRDASGHSRLELLRYQVAELDALGLADGELDSIGAEHKRLASVEHLISEGQATLALLHDADEAAVTDQLGVIQRSLDELGDIDAEFSAIRELVSEALVQAQEAADGLRRHIDTLDTDPQRLAEVEERLGAIRDLARKHHVEPEHLPELTRSLGSELAELENADQQLAQLKADREKQMAAYDEAASALTQARKSAAGPLAAQINDTIRSLGMPEARFEVNVGPGTDTARHFPATGRNRVEFLIAANPGQTTRPLEKVASGGELSRISLAIEVVAASRTRIPTLVFDEVDTGIGGGVAEIVGQQLRALGETGQSLCVTHLPQVAAQAKHHLLVTKRVSKGRTYTHIETLEKSGRVEELARMLGGVELTAQTRAHAADMIARAVTHETSE